ncbi:MAG: phosphoribosylformylglycinamidine synthase subunit PurL [Bacteroidota bacterium]|nr:phosphoribosylformylglycinamidine synthase subunit PurL [Bacteroidota bacterium]
MSNTSTASVSFHIAQNLGLNEAEYDKILSILNREPNFTELSIFSVMWSEHCSYKNSIKWLKTLPREGKGMLAKAGEENAGLVDIGDGLACAFKIESHNHPSAIEPYQGAATGVGGIHRDIFTMGARPIAALNSLRFGDLADAKTRHIVKGVVKGIGDYGNSFGVPTVAGEVYFDASYTVNPLVNAMSVGIVKQGETISATADGVGNPVYIVGSATGKDGIHGATFASGDLNEDSANDLPSVQVGDPFQEKLLLEATLEVITTGAVVGMQDMGAAGITCSTSEMSAKTGVGMDIDLDKVPTRQANMKPYEILLSESQERMLIVVQKGREAEVESVFEKWDLHCAVIGVITAGGQLRYFQNDELVAEVPAEPLVLGGGAPVYEREFTRPAYLNSVIDCNRNIDLTNEEIYDLGLNIVALPNIASKRWIYEQYDSMVQTGNVSTNKPSDAAVVVIKETGKGIAMTVDCNPYFVHANPYIGAQIAVAEAARNLVCSGAKPLAITNNLNFGNPYNPEVYYQFVEAVKGMGEACRTYDTPVTGGNVSFYNQSQEGPVLPTPTIGMIGLLENLDNHTSLKIQNQNDSVLILGGLSKDINSSQYLIQIQNIKVSKEPEFDLHKELRLQQLVLSLIDQKLISSAHDISEGGLFACLFEKLNLTKYGIKVDLPVQNLASILFGEAQGRVVVSCKAESVQMIDKLCVQYDIQLDNIGATNVSDVLQINDIVWSDKELATRYNSLFEIMNI